MVKTYSQAALNTAVLSTALKFSKHTRDSWCCHSPALGPRTHQSVCWASVSPHKMVLTPRGEITNTRVFSTGLAFPKPSTNYNCWNAFYFLVTQPNFIALASTTPFCQYKVKENELFNHSNQPFSVNKSIFNVATWDG